MAPTVPSSSIVPVIGDVLAAGELAGRQLVDQGQRERQPGRRPADAAGVDVELERQLDTLRVEGDEAHDGPVRFVGRRRQLDRDGELADVGSLELDLDRVAGFLVGERGREIVDVVQRRAVDLEQPVAGIEHLVGRARLQALRPLVVGDEAHHLADQHISRHDRHVVSDGLQRHVLRNLLGGPHRLEPEHAALLRGLEAELLLLGEELDGRLVTADEPRQNRLRRFGDGHEVEVARRRVLLGETLELTERDPLVDRLRRRRHACVRRRLDLVDPLVHLVGDELGRQQTGHADGRAHDERHADHGDRPPAMS